MTGIHEHSHGQVCEACACAVEGHVGAAPNGFRIEENQFTTEAISAEQIEQARRAIARFHEIRRTMIALGVIDADPVDAGVLQRYEQELTRARNELLILAATFVSPEHGFDDEEKLILAAVTAAKRGMSPWLLREKVELLEEIRAERDELDATNRQLRGELDRANAAVIELEEDRTAWKIRARQAERGQPKFSRPSPPADEPKDES